MYFGLNVIEVKQTSVWEETASRTKETDLNTDELWPHLPPAHASFSQWSKTTLMCLISSQKHTMARANTQHTNICRNDSAYSGYEIRRIPDVQTLTVVGILGHSDNSHWLVGNICSKHFGVAACVLVWSQHRPAGPVWPVDEVCIDGEPVEVSRSWFNYDLNAGKENTAVRSERSVTSLWAQPWEQTWKTTFPRINQQITPAAHLTA